MSKIDSNIYMSTVFVDSLNAEVTVNFTETRSYYRSDEDYPGGWDSERESLKINWVENCTTEKCIKLSRQLRDEIETLLEDSELLWVEAASDEAPEWVPIHGAVRV